MWEEGGFCLLGQLIITPGGRGKPAPGRLYGLNILRAEADLSGFWGERRLRRAGRALRRGGVLRVLAPPDFDRWPVLAALGLRPVEPLPFLQAQAVPLTLAALARQGLPPHRAAVALRGARADRLMARTAAQLCPLVRSLVVDAPRGGEELAAWLRREFGVPVLPAGERGQAAIHFQEGCPRREEAVLELWGPRPGLAGLTLSAPGLDGEDRTDLLLLTALWEAGKLHQKDIKIT